MFGIRTFLCGTLLGTCSGLFVANYHVVNTPQGVIVVPRSQRPPLRSVYVDIRSWSEAMWTNHPEVTQALIADGRSALIRENLTDNLLDEIVPEQTQTDRPRRSRSVARQSEVEVPIRFESEPDGLPGVATKAAPAKTNRLLDSKSPVRKRFETAIDDAIAPMVEDDPAELVSEQADEILPMEDAQAAMVRKLESRLSGLLDGANSATPNVSPARTEVLPASGDANGMARDLLQQVIPPSGKLPRSAAPLRDFGRDLLSAPAPGQGAAAHSPPRAPTQSRIILSEPF